MDRSWKIQNPIVTKAVGSGFDPSETLDPSKGRTRWDSRGGAPAAASAPAGALAGHNPLTAPGSVRALQRHNTEEDIQRERNRLARRRELLEVKQEIYAAENALATANLESAESAEGNLTTQAPPHSDVQSPAGLTITHGKLVGLRGPNGALNAILPQQMLASIKLQSGHQNSTGSSPSPGGSGNQKPLPKPGDAGGSGSRQSSATPPSPQTSAVQQVQQCAQDKLRQLQAIQKQLEEKKTKS